MMQALSLFLGLLVITISLTTFITGIAPAQILGWGINMLGGTFLLLLSALVVTAMFCCVRLIDSARDVPSDLERQKWLQTGLQACNPVCNHFCRSRSDGTSRALSISLTQQNIAVTTSADSSSRKVPPSILIPHPSICAGAMPVMKVVRLMVMTSSPRNKLSACIINPNPPEPWPDLPHSCLLYTSPSPRDP